MKFNNQIFQKLLFVAFTIVASGFVMSCDDDDDDPIDNDVTLTGQSKTYTLASVSDASISGTAMLEERSDNTTLVTINLNGTSAGNSHPAHIHSNSAAETGDIIIDLNNVDGETGKSETIISKMNDGTSITYNELLAIDGYLNVHMSSTDLTTLIAQGDIGGNEITDISSSYTLDAVNTSGITGLAQFTKRANGSTLVMVDLDGTSPTGEYPVYIYENDFTETGPIAIDLNSVKGDSTSFTNVRQLNNGSAITYDQLVGFDGHVGVNTSPTDTTFVAQSNIGANVN
jgi:hypothetical protein